MKPTYSELQDYLARQFCIGCPDQGPDGAGSGEGCEDCPVMDVPTEPYPDKEPADKPLGLDALAIAGLETPHEIIIAVANLSREGEQIMLRKLAWALAETGELENRRMLKEALTAASLV